MSGGEGLGCDRNARLRAAALEYAAAFHNQEFFRLAERLTGDVDAAWMAEIAPTPESRALWLRNAAEQGSTSALEKLAQGGRRVGGGASGGIRRCAMAAERGRVCIG